MFSFILLDRFSPFIKKPTNYIFKNFSFINRYVLFINSYNIYINYISVHKMTFVSCVFILHIKVAITLRVLIFMINIHFQKKESNILYLNYLYFSPGSAKTLVQATSITLLNLLFISKRYYVIR